MNILYVTHELPLPAVAGHHVRTMEIIAALPPGTSVHVIGYSEEGQTAASPASPPPGSTTFEAIPGLVRIQKRPLALATAITVSLLTGRPYSIVKYQKKLMMNAIMRHCNHAQPDLIITSLFTRHFIPPGPWKVILDTHNIEHQLWRSMAPRQRAIKAAFARREARLLQQAEPEIWRGADGIIAICQEDAATIRKASPDTPVQSVPVCIAEGPSGSRSGLKKQNDRPAFDIGMIGVWSWAPNAIAVREFEQHIMPGLDQAGLRVMIAGRGLDPAVKARLEHRGVYCPGHIEDLGDFYRSVRLIAAPFTMGGGVRMKVAEALSWRRPVIGTTLAFRGIGPGIPPGWIADDNELMTAALIRFAVDPAKVPHHLAAQHSLEKQQTALQSLIEAVRASTPAAQKADC